MQSTGGKEPMPLQECAEAATRGLGHSWRNPYWIEDLLMMGGNSACMLVFVHGEFEAARDPLANLAGEAQRRGWQDGGPRNHFELPEARNLLRAFESTTSR